MNTEQKPIPEGDAGRSPRSLGVVWEIVDATDDEIYYPLGLFANLNDAIQAATDGDYPPTDMYEELVLIEIRERQMGFGGYNAMGKKVGVARWEEIYNEEKDESTWTVAYSPNKEVGKEWNAIVNRRKSKCAHDVLHRNLISAPGRRCTINVVCADCRTEWIETYVCERIKQVEP